MHEARKGEGGDPPLRFPDALPIFALAYKQRALEAPNCVRLSDTRCVFGTTCACHEAENAIDEFKVRRDSFSRHKTCRHFGRGFRRVPRTRTWTADLDALGVGNLVGSIAFIHGILGQRRREHDRLLNSHCARAEHGSCFFLWALWCACSGAFLSSRRRPT